MCQTVYQVDAMAPNEGKKLPYFNKIPFFIMEALLFVNSTDSNLVSTGYAAWEKAPSKNNTHL